MKNTKETLEERILSLETDLEAACGEILELGKDLEAMKQVVGNLHIVLRKYRVDI